MLNHKFINLFTDFGFKRIFGTEANKDLLIDFLNNLLADEIPKIVDVKYLSTEKLGNQAQNRKAVFDLFCENEKGEKFIIELQKAEQTFFKDRSIYYATFPIQDQAKKGKDWNYEQGLVYTIAIMEFVFDWKYPEKIISHIELRDRQTNELFYEKLRFIYVEMPKFRKKLSECASNLERWLYIFKNIYLLDKIPDEIKETIFKKLFEQCAIANYNKEELMQYEQSWKECNDWQNVLTFAENKGEKRGLEQGLQQGLQQGIEKGRIEGIKKALKRGKLTLQEIAEDFEVSHEFVQKVQNGEVE